MVSVEDLLREEFADPAPPSVTADDMLARVTRARRRRVVTVAVALTVLLAVGVGVGVRALPSGAGTSPAGQPSAPTYYGELVRALFTDHTHGYVLQRRCVAQSGEVLPGTCQSELLATADAGRSWQQRPLPGEPWLDPIQGTAAFGRSPSLHPADNGAIAIDGANGRTWTSTDGGVTWHQATDPWVPGPVDSVDAIGTDERTVHLASVPSCGLTVPAVAASDGSYWSACVGVREYGQSGVAVTRDQGRTWTTHATPGTQTWWVSTVDGHTLYAAVRQPTGLVLYRSSDAGLTWTQAALIDQEPPDGTWCGLALPNGDVLVETSSGTFRLRAGTSTLERVGDKLAHGGAPYLTADWVVAPPTWVQSGTPAVGSLASLSPDGGTTWIRVPAPS